MFNQFFSTVAVVAVSVCCLLEAQSTDVQIKAYHGKYKGKEILLEGKPVTAFLGKPGRPSIPRLQ